MSLGSYIRNNGLIQKKIIRLSLVVIAGFIILLIINFLRVSVNNQIHDRQRQLQKVNQTINAYDQDKRKYQMYQSHGKIVSEDEIGQVQNQILEIIKKYGLDVQSIQPIDSPKNTNPNENKTLAGAETEITVSGPWDKTMQFLIILRNRPGILTTIQSLKMNAAETESALKTMLKYKIYVKSGGGRNG